MRKPPRHLEDAEAMALKAWCDRKMCPQTGVPIGVDLTHYPAGGKRNAREAGRLRRMGVQAGIPDFNLSIPTPEYHGLYIELKVPHGTAGRKTYATDLQLGQIDRLNRRGYKAVVAYGWIEAAVLICNYLGLDARGLQCASPP